MLKVGTAVSAANFYRFQSRADRRLFRSFRHEMATPLSGSLLHLEIAGRRLKKGQADDVPAVLESLRIAQEELERGGALLDVFGEVALDADREPEEFSLSEVLVAGASPHAEEARRRGARLEFPPAGPVPVLFGSPSQMELALSAVTTAAISALAGEGSIGWSVSAEPEGATTAICVSSGRSGESRARPAELLLARWAVEGHGGTLTVEPQSDSWRAAARFPAAGE